MTWFQRIAPKLASASAHPIAATGAGPGGESTDGIPIPVRVTATRLWRTFRRNAIAAENELGGACLEVRGRVASIDRDHRGRITVDLYVGMVVHRVRCRFGEERRDDVVALVRDGKATIRGTCAGTYLNDVVLEDCWVGDHGPHPVTADVHAAG